MTALLRSRAAWLRAGWVGLVLATLPTSARAAEGDDDGVETKLACVDGHTAVQRARRESRLLEARALAVQCAKPACPAAVRDECVEYLESLEAATPKLLVDVRGARLARLVVDGAEVASRGEPLALDPGAHDVRVETERGLAVSQSLVLVAGEGTRRVEIVMPPAAVVSDAGARGAGSSAPASDRAPSLRRPGWIPLVLGGVSAASFGTFAGFGVSGARREAALEASCAPACDPARVDAMRRDYLVADVALGVGLVAASAAVTTWLLGL